MQEFSIRQTFSNVINSSSSGDATDVFTLQIEEILNEAVLGTNGTGSIVSSDSLQTMSWVSVTSGGQWHWTTDTVDKTITSTSEVGDNGSPVSGSGPSPSDTLANQELLVTFGVDASSGTTVAGVSTGIYVDLTKGNDVYLEGEQIQTPTGSESDSLWGLDKWKNGDGGNFTLYTNGTRAVQSNYWGLSSGSDTYSDDGSDASTTVSSVAATTTSVATSTTTEYDSETFIDSGFDEYHFSGGGNIFVAADGTTSSIDNHADTDDGNEDFKVTDGGSLTDVGTNSDGSTFSYQDNFGDSDEDKSTYTDGDTQYASTANGGADTLSNDATDNDTFSSSDNTHETVTWINSYGTPTVATITDPSSDQGTLKDEASDVDAETLGGGETDQNDAISFDANSHEQDTAVDTLGITITTNGQVGDSENLDSTETVTIADVSPSSDVYDDPGTDDVNASGDTESDTSTETAVTGDTAQITDTLAATDTQALSDGTDVTTQVNDDDTDEEQDQETDQNTDQSSSQEASSASTPTSSDDDDFNDAYEETDQYTNSDQTSQTATQPVGGGRLNYGVSSQVDDGGTYGETDSDAGENNTANTSADNETASSDLTNTDQGTETDINWMNFNVTDPATGVVTSISASDNNTDQFTDSDGDQVTDGSAGSGPPTQTETATASQTDRLTETTSSSIGVVGSPAPGVTVDSLDNPTVTEQGQDSEQLQESSPSIGNDSGSDVFSSSDTVTVSDSGHSNISQISITNDGEGDTINVNSSNDQTTMESGTFCESDSGTETFSDANAQPLSDNESDTDTQSGQIVTTVTDVANVHNQYASVNPTTGLTTTVNFDDNGSTDTDTETNAETETDAHSASLTNQGTDVVSAQVDDGVHDVVQTNAVWTIVAVGSDGQGNQLNLREINSTNGVETDDWSDDDGVGATGTETDILGSQIARSGTVTNTLAGTIISVDPATGNTVTTTVSNVLSVEGRYLQIDGTSATIPLGGVESDVVTHSDSGWATENWAYNEINSEVSPGGVPVGTAVTNNSSGSDTVSDSNGVITDLGNIPGNSLASNATYTAEVIPSGSSNGGESVGFLDGWWNCLFGPGNTGKPSQQLKVGGKELNIDHMGTLTARGSIPPADPKVAKAIGFMYSTALITEAVGVTVVVVGVPGPEDAVIAGGIAAMETKAAQMGLTIVKNVAVKGLQKSQQAFKFVKNGIAATADQLSQLKRVYDDAVHVAKAPNSISALTNEAKDALRASARDIWQARTGRRAIWDGMDVHHRIPLEWSQLFPKADANRAANLIGMKSADHALVTNAWNAWRQGLNGRIPTQSEVLQQALRIDEQFGKLMKFLP